MTTPKTIKVCVIGRTTPPNWENFISGQEIFGLRTYDYSKGRYKWITVSDASNRDSIFRTESLLKVHGLWEWHVLPSPPTRDVKFISHCAIHLPSGETIITRESAAEIEELIESASSEYSVNG